MVMTDKISINGSMHVHISPSLYIYRDMCISIYIYIIFFQILWNWDNPENYQISINFFIFMDANCWMRCLICIFKHTLPQIISALMSEDVRLWGCEDVRMWGREDVRMWGCEDVRMWGCEDVRMWGREDVRMWGCEDVRMWGCEDVRTWGCENVRTCVAMAIWP